MRTFRVPQKRWPSVFDSYSPASSYSHWYSCSFSNMTNKLVWPVCSSCMAAWILWGCTCFFNNNRVISYSTGNWLFPLFPLFCPIQVSYRVLEGSRTLSKKSHVYFRSSQQERLLCKLSLADIYIFRFLTFNCLWMLIPKSKTDTSDKLFTYSLVKVLKVLLIFVHHRS